MANPSTPGLIRARAAAARLDVSTSTLKRWSAQGILPEPVRLGPRGDRFYSETDIDHLVEGRSTT